MGRLILGGGGAAGSGNVTISEEGTIQSGSSTTVHITDITTQDDDFYNDKFYLQVVRNDDSVGNAPESEYRLITDYVSSTGTFTTSAFSAAVATDDKVYVIHESIAIASGLIPRTLVADAGTLITATSYQTLFDVTGRGELVSITTNATAADKPIYKITKDDDAAIEINSGALGMLAAGAVVTQIFNMKYTKALKVEVKATSAGSVMVSYISRFTY